MPASTPPHILIDMVHPADVLFFHHPIQWLRADGARITVVSRDKDITLDLLDALQVPHTPISRAGNGWVGLGVELVTRDLQLARLVRTHRPDVMTGFGGVAISHVGRLFGIPSVAFYDAEIGALQMRLTLPFIGAWHVPECFTGPTARNRTHRFNSIKELSYLHPDQFRPNHETAVRAGLKPGRKNVLVRLVAHRAAHDLNRVTPAPEMVAGLLRMLPEDTAVHLSCEADPPPFLAAHRTSAAPLDIHHLLAHCDLFIGDSPTMAAEAAVLGVPALHLAERATSTVNAMVEAGLAFHHGLGESAAPTLVALQEIPRATWMRRRDRLLDGYSNTARYIHSVLREAIG